MIRLGQAVEQRRFFGIHRFDEPRDEVLGVACSSKRPQEAPRGLDGLVGTLIHEVVEIGLAGVASAHARSVASRRARVPRAT